MLRNSILYFMEVARSGSMRSASLALGVAQSAVSRQIQALEHEMGTALIERYPNGTRLTPAGQALFRSARVASFRIERLRSEIDEALGVATARLKVAIVESVTSYAFARAMTAFQSESPAVSMAVSLGTSSDVVDWVMGDVADFGVCLNATPSRELEIVAGFPEPLFAVVPKGHVLQDRSRVALKDLVGQRLATSSTSTGVGRVLEEAAHRSGLDLRTVLETNSLELIRQFVGGGSGLAVMTRQSCMAGLLESDVSAVRLIDPHLGAVRSTVIVAAGRQLPLAAERFMNRVIAELREVVGGPVGSGHTGSHDRDPANGP